MASKPTTFRATVTEVKRLRNDANGNPRVEITVIKGVNQTDTLRTRGGSHFMIKGDPTCGEYEIDVDGRDLITDMRKV